MSSGNTEKNRTHSRDVGRTDSGVASIVTARRVWVAGCLILAALLIAGPLLFRSYSNRSRNGQNDERQYDVQTLNDSEQFIVAQDARLRQLARSLLNLRLPTELARGLFAVVIQTTDLAPRSPSGQALPDSTYSRTQWSTESVATRESRGRLRLWHPFLETVAYFEHARFDIVRGRFITPRRFEAEVAFEGLAFTVDETWEAVRATQNVSWHSPETDSPYDVWKIDAWHLNDFETQGAKTRLFTERTAEVLSSTDLVNARRSIHEELVIQLAVTRKLSLPDRVWARYFHVDSGGHHPGLSVVDVDGDGHDDLYVTVREGANKLFRNRGDGTFEERAADFGLAIEGFSTSSIFADFDNDGDVDLMLGRYFKRSMYFRNEGGKFVDSSASHVATELPYLVSSVSAADYNNDGLLDIYLATYGIPPVGVEPAQMGEDFFEPDDARKFVRRYEQARPSDKYLEEPGPPNLLLVNRGGGRFEVAPESPELELWMNSFQATWSDFDDDGDTDLYVANDYGPDFLFRNEDGHFVDVTRRMGGEAMMGLGMGVSWGDYDNDGRQDLYVSNMFSKAGQRITEQIPGVDERITRSTEGNLLFRNLGKSFELVSGLGASDLHVAKAGWSWGGQFVDLDNDGYLDIYVSSGYYSAPEEVDSGVDL